ncbi:MAG: hypothetical protein WA860_09990 [Acidimicrobiales bacterium]
MSQKDRDTVREWYNTLADAEWDRLEATARGRVSYVVHRRFLSSYVAPGDVVLEVGAGPGRFTAVLAVLGARVAVADISPVQLELNAQHMAGTDAEGAVISMSFSTSATRRVMRVRPLMSCSPLAGRFRTPSIRTTKP